MLDVHIVDGEGTKKHLGITPEGALKVAITTTKAPQVGSDNIYRYFKPILGSTGADSGTLSQNINGSSTPQEFYIEAAIDYDIKIANIVILIADGYISHQKFGALSALTNGWSLVFRESGMDTYIIKQAKSNGDLIVQAGALNTFGAGVNLNIIPNFIGTSDGLLVSIPVSSFMPEGLRIGKGTYDRLYSVVADDLTGLDDLKVYTMGYRHY